MQHPISITAISSVSALGNSPALVWESYQKKHPLFSRITFDETNFLVSKISAEIETQLTQFVAKNPNYKRLDRTVLLALLAAQHLEKSIKKSIKKENIGINIGSSRGATGLFESYYSEFLKTTKVSPFTSPTTTLGNVSSWVGQQLQVRGIAIDHSVTCSTALHALLNGIAWLQSGMADQFIVGGSEAPLTPFTVAQMQSLQLYSKNKSALPCESMRFEKKQNTMVLGEGAALALLERGVSKNTKAIIKGIGFASETVAHNSAISENAQCFQDSMKKALQSAKLATLDAIVMHAPGTVKGDLAEKNAIDLVFGKQLPLLTSNKWMLGHTFGSSGMFSIEMAIEMLQHNKFVENPFYNNARHLPDELKTIMVNAVGFGGNAVSLILEKYTI